MEKISQKEFHQLFDGNSIILEKDRFGTKVVETSDKKIIKLFRLKRYFSSALLNPYAVRFKNNSEGLKRLDIPSITVEKMVYCPEEKRYIVVYKKLEGSPLRQVLEKAFDSERCLQLARFVALLHRKGVYFRSLHLGNILLMDNGELALIDIADMRLVKKSLSPHLRVRNFRHLLRYDVDVRKIKQLGLGCFLLEYLKTAEKSPEWEVKFRRCWKDLKLPA